MSPTETACVIHKSTGEVERRIGRAARVPEASAVPIPTIAALVPITAIMTRTVVCVHADLTAPRVLALIVDSYLGCLPVVDDDGRPIGMITKRDLVDRNELAETAEDLMLPLAITLDEYATVARAAALMAHEDVHHIPVIGPRGRLVGIVSSLDIVRWLARNDGYAQP